MQAYELEITTDTGQTYRQRLDRFPCVIGRGKDCTVNLTGWRVGKRHAQIHRTERILRLVDEGTLNGTWVNGQRIAEYAPLDETDEIVLGGYRLRVFPSSTQEPSNVSQGLASNQTSSAQNTSLSAVESSLQTPGSVNRFSTQAALSIRRELHQQMLRNIDLRRKDVRQLNDRQLKEELTGLLVELIEANPNFPVEINKEELISTLLSEALGLGPLDELLQDPNVSEIMVNSAQEIFVEKHGKLSREPICFSSDEAVRVVIDRIVQPLGRRIDDSSPMVDARLPDGSRVNAIIPPLAIRGPSITIRKFGKRFFTPEALLEQQSISPVMHQFLRVAIHHRLNIVVSGGTGSGKTTLLNVLSSMIPRSERIVTIEDSAELKLQHPNLVALESRPPNMEGKGLVTIRELVRNALRMRPDRIVVGEVRGGEALDMLQAMNTGHDGSLTTVHANSPRDVFSRLEVMSLMAGIDMPISALREQIASAIQLIVHQTRFADGRRRVSSIYEVTGIEAGRIQSQELFRYVHSPHGGEFRACGVIPEFYERLGQAGVDLDLSIFDKVSHGAFA